MWDERSTERMDDAETPAAGMHAHEAAHDSECRSSSPAPSMEPSLIRDGELPLPQASRTGDDDHARRVGDSQEGEEEAMMPQWLDGRASADHEGLGLGLAIWPPTPGLPTSPLTTSSPPQPSSTPASSLLSSCPSSRSTSPTIANDYAISPVDLVAPSAERMPSVSVADGPMGRLSAGTSQSQTRSFFSNLFSRSSRSGRTHSSSGSPASSTGSSPAESQPDRFDDVSAQHGRSTSMPQLASAPEPRYSAEMPRPVSRQSSRSPRSLAARTFASISRSTSTRSIDRDAGPPRDPPYSPQALPVTDSGTSTSRAPPLGPAPPLSSIGLTLNSITPNLSLSRNSQPLCGAILDGRYLLIGTTSGLDFLPLPEVGSLPVQHTGLKKRRETRKPLSLIKRTRFKRIVVLGERSNVLVAIAGRNDHARVYALDGIRAMIERRMSEVDPLQGYPISSLLTKGKKQEVRIPMAAATSSEDFFASYQFPAGARAPELSPPGRDPLPTDPRTSRPPSLCDRRAASNGPIRISQRAGISAAPVVRAIPTVHSPRQSMESSPTSSLADFFRETGPETAPPELDKLISVPRRHSLDGVLPDGTPKNAHFPLGRGLADPPRLPRLRRLSSIDTGFVKPEEVGAGERQQRRPLSCSAVPSSPTLGLADILQGSGPPRSRTMLARSPVIDEQDAAATARALLETLSEEPPSAHLRGSTPRAGVGSSFNGARTFPTRRGSRVEAPPLNDSTSGRGESRLAPPGAELVNVVPTYPRSGRRPSQQNSDRYGKRRSIASLCSGTDRSFWAPNAHAHPASVDSPLEYVKLARSRGAWLLKAVETRRRTYLALLVGDEKNRIELFTGSKNISLSLNRTFVLPDTPRSIELQLQGDELADIYLIYADTIFALEPVTVRVREVSVGRAERRAQRQHERHQEEQERLMREGPSGAVSDSLRHGGSSGLPSHELHRFVAEEAIATDPAASSSPPTYVQPLSNPSSPPRATVSTGADRVSPIHDYSGFQQLPFIPPFPPSILGPSWVIPPLYTDVVTDAAGPAAPPIADAELLLPPVSLLGGAALRNNGPPGLFFCSKRGTTSSIITADGKSVIKAPLRWSSTQADSRNDTDDNSEPFEGHRLELLVPPGKATVAINLSARRVEALPIVGDDELPLPLELPLRARASVQFLASDATGAQLFFAEATGTSYAVKCLSGLS
ncbi:hypothetical protein JCM3774_003330 [Rhodotorula dairenensis]